MSPESVKTFMTYFIAWTVIAGGGLLLVVPTRVQPSDLLPFLTGIIGSVITWVFSERMQAMQANRLDTAYRTPAASTTVHTAPDQPVTINTGDGAESRG